MVAAAAVGGCGAGNSGGAGGSGGSGGSPPRDIPCASTDPSDDGRVPCPGWSGGAVDALPFLAKAASVATITGVPVKWVGLIQGQQIARDGTPTGGDLARWSATFCLTTGEIQDDALSVRASGDECLAKRDCESMRCVNGDVPVPPAIDAATAIHNAFPDDPEGTTYTVQFAAPVRRWDLTSSNGGVMKKVHADTGAVITD
jgi:hypothetical protein